MKKIIFCDIDGTIVDHCRDMHFVSEALKNAFSQLKENHYVFIASGRSKCLLSEDILSLPVNGYLLCNGTYAEMDGKVLFEESMSESSLKMIENYFSDQGGVYYQETQKCIYTNGKGSDIHIAFNDNWDIPEMVYVSDKRRPDDKISIVMAAFANDEQLEKAVLYFSNEFEAKPHLGGFSSMDLNIKGQSKGHGIEQILNILSLSKDDAYAFGDGLNDLEMMDAVTHSIAMGNACEQLKHHASEVCEDVLYDGVVHALRRHKLIV